MRTLASLVSPALFPIDRQPADIASRRASLEALMTDPRFDDSNSADLHADQSTPADEQAAPVRPARDAPATAQQRGDVQRLINQLLNELAPEQAVTRGDRVPVPIDRRRTPTGCILQAPDAALSVSWFADAANDGTPG